MLTLLEGKKEKTEAHQALVSKIKKSWSRRENRLIVWRPSSRPMEIFHNGKYWFASSPLTSRDTTPRYWDPYGIYNDTGNLQIAVEINVPTNSNSRRISGLFAKDSESGETYLLHDGGVGGGRKGVGRSAFLAWSDAKLVAVVDSKGDVRPAIIVAPIDSRGTAEDIGRFVQKALDFKAAVARGETDTMEARSAQQTYDDYYDEFAGKKRRRRLGEIEYVSRHGDIVKALRNWRRRTAARNEKIVKNAYIDLGIQSGGLLKELYEVKTSCDRQSLYSAIGQVVVHGNGQDGSCKRFLVLPNNDDIPDDVSHALKRASISLLRFELQGDKVRIMSQ